MIKLLCILLTVTHLNGQNSIYLLPDKKSIFESWLYSKIKQSVKPIFILTHSMDYQTLKKSFILHQSHGYELTMIVNRLDKNPLELIQYQNTRLFHYKARHLQGSLILIEPYVCQMSVPFDQELFSSTTSTVSCTDDIQTFNAAKDAFTLIQKRSTTYLK